VESEKNIIPHEFVVFGLSTSKSPTEVTLRSAEWAVITQIDGHKTIKEIAEILALSLDEAFNLFNGLYEKELIRIISTDRIKEEFVNDDFFETLEKQLTAVIGPVAPIVLEDTLWAMDTTQDRFSIDRIPELIENLSDEITDEDKKVEFQKLMLAKIKGMKEG